MDDDMKREVEDASFDLLPVGVALLKDKRGAVFGRTESVAGVLVIDGGVTNEWTGCSNAAAAMTTEDIIAILICKVGK